MEHIAIFGLLHLRMRKDLFGTEKCKVTFGIIILCKFACAKLRHVAINTYSVHVYAFI